MPEKIVLLLDADECIFSKELISKKKENSHGHWTYSVYDLFNAHPKLWCSIFQLAETLQPEGIELIQSSFLRQTPELDSYYSRTNQTGLFSSLLPEIINLLKKFTSIGQINSIKYIQESKTRLPHLMNIKPTSHSLKNTVQGLPPFKIMFISIYLLLQQLGKENEGRNKLRIFMTNANPLFLDTLSDTFLNFEKQGILIIPQNITLYLCKYDNTTQNIAVITVLRGNGSINHTFKMFEAHIKHQYSSIEEQDQTKSALAYCTGNQMPLRNEPCTYMYDELKRAHSNIEVLPHFACTNPASLLIDPDESNLKSAASRSTQESTLHMNTSKQLNFFSAYIKKITHSHVTTPELQENNVGNFKEIPMIYSQNADALTEKRHVIEQPITIDTTPRQLSPASTDSLNISTSREDTSVGPDQPYSEEKINIPLTETVDASSSWCCCT